NNPEKNNYSPSKATPDPIIRNYSLYHGLIVHLPEHRARFNRNTGQNISVVSQESWLLDRPWQVVAQNRSAARRAECPLSGVKQTWLFAVRTSAYDPKRTLLASVATMSEPRGRQ
ncbi:MAG: hypothetical protein WB052_16075, partial [Pseudolabrys sp.]